MEHRVEPWLDVQTIGRCMPESYYLSGTAFSVVVIYRDVRARCLGLARADRGWTQENVLGDRGVAPLLTIFAHKGDEKKTSVWIC